MVDRRAFMAMASLGLMHPFGASSGLRRLADNFTTGNSPVNIEPFTIRIPDAEIADLKHRLQRARWTDEIAGAGWDDGANVDYMRALCAYWANDFDWRAQERRLNGFPQFKAMIDGSAVHFIHARGKGPNPLPIIVTHGWPSSFAEFSKLIPRLTDPVA